MNERRHWLGFALTLLLSISPAISQDSAEEDTGFKEIELFTEVLETIRQGYVDPEKVTYEKLISSALEGMLADLDPHCQFMQPKVLEQLKRHTDSTYEGIGVTISTKNDALTIVTVREDNPPEIPPLWCADGEILSGSGKFWRCDKPVQEK